jgi:hypothetical protein
VAIFCFWPVPTSRSKTELLFTSRTGWLFFTLKWCCLIRSRSHESTRKHDYLWYRILPHIFLVYSCSYISVVVLSPSASHELSDTDTENPNDGIIHLQMFLTMVLYYYFLNFGLSPSSPCFLNHYVSRDGSSLVLRCTYSGGSGRWS